MNPALLNLITLIVNETSNIIRNHYHAHPDDSITEEMIIKEFVDDANLNIRIGEAWLASHGAK